MHKALGAITHLSTQQDGSEDNGLKIAEAGGVELVLEALERVNIQFESHAYMAPGIVTAFSKNRHTAVYLNRHMNQAAKLVVNSMNRYAESSARMTVVTFTAIQAAAITATVKKPNGKIDFSMDCTYEWGQQYMSLNVCDTVSKCLRLHRNDPHYGPLIVQLATQILHVFTGSGM